MLTKEKILEALKKVYDWEVGANIVDLGLIYDINVSDDNVVHVKMTLTAIGCPLQAMFVQQVEAAVRALGAKDVSVELTFDPPWNPNMMSDELKRRFGYL